DDGSSRRAVEVERAFLAELGSGCSLPVGAHASDTTLTAFLANEDGTRHLIEIIELPDDHVIATLRGASLADSMRSDI
ncbi:MAG TPA: hypothetical protein VGC84_11985, partial [Ilumatobacteraceae bacterium]